VFTARYALSPYIKQIRFVFKGLTSALDGGGWWTPRPGRFTLGKETRYALYSTVRAPHVRFGRMRKNSLSTGTQSPDHPARGQCTLSHVRRGYAQSRKTSVAIRSLKAGIEPWTWRSRSRSTNRSMSQGLMLMYQTPTVGKVNNANRKCSRDYVTSVRIRTAYRAITRLD
jgi:hypothetical protein